MNRSKQRDKSGIALVLTLAFLVIATILVVGFASSMRTERQAAASMANNVTATLVTQTAIDHAVAILDKNIPQPLVANQSPLANNWSIAPGQLFVGGNTIPLYSGGSTSSLDANLNQADTSGKYPILQTSTPLRVAWINLLADPSKAADGTVKLSNGSFNQIIARYAFWMDDENSKININTAYGKPSPGVPPVAGYFNGPAPVAPTTSGQNVIDSYSLGVPAIVTPGGTSSAATTTSPYSLGHPASVNLDLLGSIDRLSLWNFIHAGNAGRWLTAASNIKQYSNNTSVYEQNKFWLTAYNADPEFNCFGKPRIFLTDATAQTNDNNNVGTGSFGFSYVSESSTTLRATYEPLTFHSDISTSGSSDNPSSNPAANVVSQISYYLSHPWPSFSTTFVAKWSTNPGTADTLGAREADQVAWNIFGMAASAANATNNGRYANLTPQIKQTTNPTTELSRFLWNGPLSAARILPQTRSPFITRLGISFATRQKDRRNGTIVDPTTGKGLTGTKYVINMRLIPQVRLPWGYQGYGNESQLRSWDTNNDEFYVTHFEATFDDQNGTSGTVHFASDSPIATDPALWHDASSNTNLWKDNGVAILQPDVNSVDFRVTIPPDGNANHYDFCSYDQPSADPSPRPNGPASTIIFDAGATHKPCKISNIKIRFAVGLNAGSIGRVPYQISPIRDIDRGNGFEGPTASDMGAIKFPDVTVDTTAPPAGADAWVTMETLDPRVNQRGTNPISTAAAVGDDWYPGIAARPTQSRNQRLGMITDYPNAYPYSTSGSAGTKSNYNDETKCAWIDASPLIGTTRAGSVPGETFNRMPSTGLLSLVSTGIQGGRPWRTLRFQKVRSSAPGGDTDTPPDWLLLDLFAVPFNQVNLPSTSVVADSTKPPSITYLNSSAGKVNINNVIFPRSFNLTASDRDIPLRALLYNMYRPALPAAVNNSNGSSVIDDASATNLVSSINSYLMAKTDASGNPHQVFDYPGEICEVPGFSDGSYSPSGSTDWQREALIRNLASLITTRSNCFSIWGAVQTIKKIPGHTDYSHFETNDQITGEKRFHAVIERYVWPGVDTVAGNGQTNSSGTYAQLGSTSYLGSSTNTIDATDPTQSSFFQSFNPGAAVIKYRVVSFEYIE